MRSAFYKLIALCAIVLVFACNNSSAPGEKNESSKKAALLPADSMSRDALFSFVDGCVANAKITLGEEKAFGFCKCIYEQLRKNHPDIDSTKLIALANDTAQVAKMAASCR